jgi:thymidine kinase
MKELFIDTQFINPTMGSITLIIGCMFSGKSTEIMRLIKRYKVLKKKILIINHKSDQRYATDSISTHDQQQIECEMVDSLMPIKQTEKYRESHVIVIEEAQFFTDLFDFTTGAADNDHKTVIVAGLSGDFNRNPFGDIQRLIPHAENITKLSALCVKCGDGTLAHFSKRIDVTNQDQTLVGTTSEYIAVCRKHYNAL